MNKAALVFRGFREATATTDLDKINSLLNPVGVHLSTFDIPKGVRPILSGSKKTPLNPEQYQIILDTFCLDRKALLEQIHLAGGSPAVANGGSLTTQEKGMAPYPKVYDLITMDAATLAFVQEKFGKLHVNCTDDMVGIDEVMSVLSGGPWRWFFRLKDNRVVMLHLEFTDEYTQGFRLYYPGLTPHGALVNTHGLCVAQAIGPDEYVTRYQMDDIPGSDLLNTNPWIDFTTNPPKLLD